MNERIQRRRTRDRLSLASLRFEKKKERGLVPDKNAKKEEEPEKKDEEHPVPEKNPKKEEEPEKKDEEFFPDKNKEEEKIEKKEEKDQEAEDIEAFCNNFGGNCQHFPELRGAGNFEEEAENDDFRGGAGGSNATEKKRDIGDCLDKIASILKDKTNAEETKELEELIKEAKGHLGNSKLGAQGQSFCGKTQTEAILKKEKEEVKESLRQKERPKRRMICFDLSRRWPKAQQTTWQSIRKALEEGEIPRGEIAIVKNVQQLRQLQALAHDLKINKSLLLVAKRTGTDDVPETCQSLLLPWMGNLAMIDAVLGLLRRTSRF